MKKAITLKLTDQIHKDAKIKCIINNTNLSSYIEKLIQIDLENDQKKSEC